MPERVSARREDGSMVCLSELPPRNTRWTRLRKRAVVECHDLGLIETGEVLRRYGMTVEELDEWRVLSTPLASRDMIWTDRPRVRSGGVVTAGEMCIDLDREVLLLGGLEIDTSPSEWIILTALAEADGAVVTTAMILGALYGRQEDAAGSKTADVLICRLRKKLGRHSDRISAVWGRGYRLIR